MDKQNKSMVESLVESMTKAQTNLDILANRYGNDYILNYGATLNLSADIIAKYGNVMNDSTSLALCLALVVAEMTQLKIDNDNLTTQVSNLASLIAEK